MAGDPLYRARSLEGSGIVLSMQGQSDAAMADLKTATGLDKTLWRAWNALGREYDLKQDWPKSKAAYSTALAIPGANTAIVLNNQGYSLLLQKQMDGAAADFVAALERDPSLAAARTNLRLTLAVEGNYARASVIGVGDDKAAVLNNVGLAAAMRGDYLEADKLLNQAIAAKGQYYGRAAENLQLSRNLAERTDEATVASDAPR
jgi:Flp pilus assembly protein TadD